MLVPAASLGVSSAQMTECLVQFQSSNDNRYDFLKLVSELSSDRHADDVVRVATLCVAFQSGWMSSKAYVQVLVTVAQET